MSINRKNQFKNLGVYTVKSDVPVEDKGEEFVSLQNPLLEVIYAPDEKTGLPSSDIAVFMSPKTSSEVRQYIQQNLMQTVTPVKSQFVSDVDFETAVSLQRGMSESLSDYASRVSAFAHEQQKLIESSNSE